MKILFYVSGISKTIGGIEKFILNFLEAQSNNVDIEILTRFYDKDTIVSNMFIEKKIKIHSLQVEHLNQKTLGKFRKKVNEFFEEHEGQYDVVHSNYIVDPFVIVAAKRHGIKKVYTHVHSYNKFSFCISSYIKKLALLTNSLHATACFACSSDVGNAEYPFWGKRKLCIINNGINANKFRFDKDTREFCRNLLGVGDSFVLCTVSRMEPVKNQLYLVEIFYEVQKKCNKSKLLFVGNGSQCEKIKEKCIDLKIIDKVIFAGECSNVEEILQASDAFILTSKHEGFGMAVIEAQAAGLQTFVSDMVIPKCVDCTGLVKFVGLDESPHVWAEIIIENALNYSRLDQYYNLKRAGYDYVESSAQLMDIYTKE